MHSSSSSDATISVVIPARNEQEYVAAALASVAAERWPQDKLEAIVVDNASTDATAAAVEAFLAATPRLAVRLLDCPKVGVAAARNCGATAATGEYLIFLDADSRMAPDLVEAVARHARAGCPAGSIRVVADSHDPLDRAFFGMIEFGKVLFGIQAQMFYCERRLFLAQGAFDERLQLAEDREFLVRLQKAGVPMCHVRESYIATSTRRLHARRWRLGMFTMLLRWALANQGIGRQWQY